MDCLRGRPMPGDPYHPACARNYMAAFAIPWVRLASEQVRARGMHVIVASAQRIPEASVNPRAKNFHWADLTQGLWEAHDAGVDGRMLRNDRPGPVGSDLRDLFWAKRAQGWHATPIDYASEASER